MRQKPHHLRSRQAGIHRRPGLNILDNLLRELHQLDCNLADSRTGKAGDTGPRVIVGRYKGLVESYTPRELTFSRNVLNAFAGVFSVICGHIPRGSVCGKPAVFLDLARLRNLARALKRGEEDVVGGSPLAGRAGAPEKCPVWPWAGWVGPVEYRLFMEAERKRPIPGLGRRRNLR